MKWKEGHLGRTLLWRGWGLGRGARGRGGRALQRAQSLAEPRVLGCLNLIHQDAPLVLELLQSDKKCGEESARGVLRTKARVPSCSSNTLLLVMWLCILAPDLSATKHIT